MMLQGHKNSGKRCPSFTSNAKCFTYKTFKSSPLLRVLPIICSQPEAAICVQESGGKCTMASLPSWPCGENSLRRTINWRTNMGFLDTPPIPDGNVFDIGSSGAGGIFWFYLFLFFCRAFRLRLVLFCLLFLHLYHVPRYILSNSGGMRYVWFPRGRIYKRKGKPKTERKTTPKTGLTFMISLGVTDYSYVCLSQATTLLFV